MHENVVKLLPPNIIKELNGFENLDKLQEIRLKVNAPIILQNGENEIITKVILTLEDLKLIIQRISQFSLYAFEEELKQGFITVKGGHRIGICGSYVLEKGSIKTIKDPGSINIRISREVLGCSKKIMQYIEDNENVNNTLLISPPRCGKTTLLRDICRNVSNGFLGIKGKRVCVIDERSELGACYFGIPQMDLGIRSDVLDNCPKGEGIIIAIRTMAPEVILCDEIGSNDDVYSILKALNSGVNIIASIHGYNLNDYTDRAVFKALLENKVFKRVIILSKRNGAGTIEKIYDLSREEEIIYDS